MHYAGIHRSREQVMRRTYGMYVTGKVNYSITGLSFGMKAKEIMPAGWILISIPYHWIPTIVQNLKEMEWVLPSYTEGREKFYEREKRVMKGISK